MRKHFDLKIGTGAFYSKRKKQAIADEAALDGFYVVRTNVPEERMSAAVETYKRLGRVERAFRTMKASDLQVRPIRHRREPRVRAHLLICMLAYYVEKHMRDALAPVRDSPVAKAEHSPQARRKAASKRTSSGDDVHDFRGLLAQLGTLTMNRIEPSGPEKPGFDVPASPSPALAKAGDGSRIAQPRYRRSPCGSPSLKQRVQQTHSRNPQNMPDIQRVVQNSPKEIPARDWQSAPKLSPNKLQNKGVIANRDNITKPDHFNLAVLGKIHPALPAFQRDASLRGHVRRTS